MLTECLQSHGYIYFVDNSVFIPLSIPLALFFAIFISLSRISAIKLCPRSSSTFNSFSASIAYLKISKQKCQIPTFILRFLRFRNVLSPIPLFISSFEINCWFSVLQFHFFSSSAGSWLYDLASFATKGSRVFLRLLRSPIFYLFAFQRTSHYFHFVVFKNFCDFFF